MLQFQSALKGISDECVVEDHLKYGFEARLNLGEFACHKIGDSKQHDCEAKAHHDQKHHAHIFHQVF